MMEKKVYKDDEGTILYFYTGVDISTGTTFDVKVKKPDGTTTSWTGELYGTKYVKYTLTTGDVDQAGTYSLQAYVEIGTWKVRGKTVELIVYNNFE